MNPKLFVDGPHVEVYHNEKTKKITEENLKTFNDILKIKDIKYTVEICDEDENKHQLGLGLLTKYKYKFENDIIACECDCAYTFIENSREDNENNEETIKYILKYLHDGIYEKCHFL